MAMMRTAGPGGEAPDPVVCKCGVSRHHLRLEGYVTMSATDTAHPVATIKSHRQSALANLPQMEKDMCKLTADLQAEKQKTNSQAKKLHSEHEQQKKLRADKSGMKKKLQEQEQTVAQEKEENKRVRALLKQKEGVLHELMQSATNGNAGDGGKKRKAEEVRTRSHPR